MGQKVHPIGFRLGITHKHASQWYAIKKNYSKYLFEDYFLRKTLHDKYGAANFEKIEISRKIEDQHLEIKIYAEKPQILIGTRGDKKQLKNFQQEIKNIIYNSRQIYNTNETSGASFDLKVALYIFGCSQVTASLIAYYLVDLLEKRSSYRRALNELFRKKLKFVDLEQGIGIKIQFSGRLNGAEIARREWIREGGGRLPLQTLYANIDYCFKQALTIYGVLGIKVWVFGTKKIV